MSSAARAAWLSPRNAASSASGEIHGLTLPTTCRHQHVSSPQSSDTSLPITKRNEFRRLHASCMHEAPLLGPARAQAWRHLSRRSQPRPYQHAPAASETGGPAVHLAAEATLREHDVGAAEGGLQQPGGQRLQGAPPVLGPRQWCHHKVEAALEGGLPPQSMRESLAACSQQQAGREEAVSPPALGVGRGPLRGWPAKGQKRARRGRRIPKIWKARRGSLHDVKV